MKIPKISGKILANNICKLYGGLDVQDVKKRNVKLGTNTNCEPC